MLTALLEGDGTRTVQSVNHVLCEFLGYRADELIGTDFARLTHPDDVDDSLRAVEDLRSGETNLHIRRKRYRHRDGHYLWAELHARALPTEASSPLVLVHVLDVGDQVQLEESQQERALDLEHEVEQRTVDLATVAARLRLSLAAGGMTSWTYDIARDELNIEQLSQVDQNVQLPTNGDQVRPLIHPDDLDTLRRAISTSAKSPEGFDVTVRGAGEAERRWLRLAGDVSTDPEDGGRPVMVIGIVQDVTIDRANAEQAQLRNQRLNLALMAGRLGTWELDTETGSGWLDDQAKDMLGLPLDQPADFGDIASRVHPDDQDAFAGAVTAGLVATNPAETLQRVRHSDGSYRWIRTAGLPVTDPTTGHLIVVGINRDVTEEQQAQLDLRERQEYLSLVLESTTTGVWDWDFGTDTIHFSDSWRRAYGYLDADIGQPGWHWADIIHPDDWEAANQKLRRHLRGVTDVLECECRIRRADGTWRWTRIRGQVTDRDEDGRARRLLAVDTDITEQRRMEAQLVHASKMQALGLFSGGIAHDFNNVLAVIRGHAEAAERDSALAPRTTEHLAAIGQAVERSAALVRKLMLLGRPAGDEPVSVDISDYLRTAEETIRQLIGESVELEVDLTAHPVAVEIDESRFEALVLNLVANARDALPDGGTITLATRLADDGSTVEFEVADTGIGMDAATLESMFDPYFTTKGTDLGTGLGLATSYSTVSHAGGTISASSVEGKGTTVLVRLPLTQNYPEQSSRMAGHQTVGSTPATILMVEDDAELLELSADLLRDAGHRVFESLDAVEALEILDANDDIELLVTDALLPGLSGSALVAEATRRRPALKTLFLSGYAPAIDNIDPAHLLIKPVGAEQLITAVNHRLRSAS